MKKIFQKIVDRIHGIWIVLTRKNFAVFVYNEIIYGERTKGTDAVISEIDNEQDRKLFYETISEYLTKLNNECTNSLS